MAKRSDWIHHFSAAELAELHEVTMAADASGRDLTEFTLQDFPLPALRPTLMAAQRELLRGRGFQVFRGVPVERYTKRQAAILYWAIGLNLGEPVSQNAAGHLLGHVTNSGLNYADPEVRGYQTKARLAYHTDSSDVVGLLCLKKSKSGGLSSIVSSTTLWNELVARQPAMARILMGNFHRTRWGEVPAGKNPWCSNPIFAPCDGYMVASYVRSAIHKGQNIPGVPKLTPAQIEAFDFLDSLAMDPEIHLDMELEPGDIQIVSNHFILHSRTAYEDHPEPERRRYLMRLWLACADGPAIPASITERLGLTASGRPAGITVPGVVPIAPVDIH
ncbi:MAG: TauD/TfdA family dioxygenase [Burkholderiales bacterium]|nr:TauD/TfdA family dioxygenase [Burkholderiales bacterium]